MFSPTHTINGTPVEKIIPPTGWPWFRDEQGQKVRVGRGAKSVPLDGASSGGKGAATVVAPPPPKAAPKPPPVELAPAVVGATEAIHAEVALAVLKAACWPCYGESCGYGESLGGHSGTLEGVTPEGDMRVRVSINTPQGGRFFYVRVPKALVFEVVE